MTAILDTNHDTTRKLDSLKAAGVKTLIRYIASGDKSITPSEARAIASAGVRLALVYEAWGDTHGEISADLGAAHARDTLARAPLLGAPSGCAVYFAIDNDESPNSLRNRILPYFRAIKSTLNGKYRVGVYGPGTVCAAALDAGVVDLAWLANATGWSGYASFKVSQRWSILQHLPQNIAGLDTDPDEINPARPDIGDFVPFGGVMNPAPTPTPTVTLADLQAALNVEVGPIETLDKLAQMTLAIRSFQKTNGLGVDGVAGSKTLGALPTAEA